MGEVNKAALETHFEYDGKDDYTEYRKELNELFRKYYKNCNSRSCKNR